MIFLIIQAFKYELRHCRNQTIDSDFMDTINHGACRNMVDYPELIKQYRALMKKNAFYTDKPLKHQISIIIDYAERCACENIPKTKKCLIE